MVCRSRRPSRSPILVALASLSWSAVSGAQYTPPGTAGAGGGIPTGESLRAKYEAARWHAGGLALDPWLGLRDGTVVEEDDSQGDRRRELTLTVGAGLRAYLRLGPKVLVAGHVLPEYVYWSESSAREQWNGRYGLGLFADWNRLAVEISARRLEDQTFFSPEVLTLTSQRTDRTRAAIELALTRRLDLEGSFEHREARSEAPDEEALFRLLDRDEDRLRLGLALGFGSHLRLGVAVEEGETRFLDTARDLSGSESAAVAHAAWEGRRFGSTLAVERRSLEADPGSLLPERDETTGHFDLRFEPSRRLGLLAYARRDVVFSIREDAAYLASERLGLRLQVGGASANVAIIAETGSDDVRPIAGAAPRRDDAVAYGAELRFAFRRWAEVSIGGLRSEIDSPIDDFDLAVTTVRTSIRLGLASERLRLGEPPGEW